MTGKFTFINQMGRSVLEYRRKLTDLKIGRESSYL
jgi:hypothetical protein